MSYYLSAWKNIFNYRGRSRRKVYWTFALVNALVIILIAAGILFCTWDCVKLEKQKYDTSQEMTEEMVQHNHQIEKKQLPLVVIIIVLSLVILLLAVVLIVPGISLFVRRLHDIGYSGWWTLLFAVLGILGGTANTIYSLHGYKALQYFYFVLTAVSTILGLLVACLPSQPGENKYGPNPVEIGEGK